MAVGLNDLRSSFQPKRFYGSKLLLRSGFLHLPVFSNFLSLPCSEVSTHWTSLNPALSAASSPFRDQSLLYRNTPKLESLTERKQHSKPRRKAHTVGLGEETAQPIQQPAACPANRAGRLRKHQDSFRRCSHPGYTARTGLLEDLLHLLHTV